MNNSIIYGPVRSRRLGYSLGVDIIPLKTCSFDCIFCELVRRTDQYTMERKPYLPGKLAIEAVEKALSNLNMPLDSITFSGSGEPTLNSDLGMIISGIKAISKIPITVFTNSSLLNNDEVIKDLNQANRVKFTLSSLTPELFNRINRPVSGITLDMVKAGITNLSSKFIGELWLEIMIMADINNTVEEMSRIREFISDFPLSQIHLNRPVRASTEPNLEVMEVKKIAELIEIFYPFKVSIV